MLRIAVSAVCVDTEATIRHVAEVLNDTGIGAVLVLDDQRRLIGIVTDGDLRRAVLRLEGFQHKAITLLIDAATGQFRDFLWAPISTSTETLLAMMRQNGIRHVPLLDADGRPLDIARLEDLAIGVLSAPEPLVDAEAVIMAGGFGSRLRPLTDDIPKPMLPVGDRPLLEIIVGQLRQAGITKIVLSTFYQADMIHNHFGDGSRFDVKISYLSEDKPLGTAGALSLLPRPSGPLVVLNGDILTHTNLASMVHFHRKHDALFTIGSHYYEVEIPYGVLEVQDAEVMAVQEKPKLNFLVNAGLYVLSPKVFEFLEPGRHCNMTDLITKVRETHGRVVAFPIVEYWRDIGRVSDYLKAIKDHEATRAKN